MSAYLFSSASSSSSRVSSSLMETRPWMYIAKSHQFCFRFLQKSLSAGRLNHLPCYHVPDHVSLPRNSFHCIHQMHISSFLTSPEQLCQNHQEVAQLPGIFHLIYHMQQLHILFRRNFLHPQPMRSPIT